MIIILSKWLNSSIRSTNVTLTGTTSLGQSGSGINGNKEVQHIPQRSMTGASPSYSVLCANADRQED